MTRNKTPSEICDIIVAGGGSAGCAMAARLADAGLDVMLLEAGKSDRDIRLLVPALTIAVVHNSKYDWCLPAEPDPSIGGRADSWPAGRRLGGGSAINGMIYVRGHAYDYNRWEAMGASGWSATDVAPYFRRIETNARGGDDVRGDCGPIGVTDNRVDYPIIDAFIDAAVAYGIPRNPDHNGARAGEGVDIAQASQHGGLRCSAARGYLRHRKSGAGPRVVTEAIVRLVLIQNRRAVGVVYEQDGRHRELRARYGVVVSAGCLNTPKLLMLSGIGPASSLKEHGIACVADLPGVGANLQEHVGTHIVAKVNQATVNSDTRGLAAVRQGFAFLLRRRGGITSSMCHAQSFVRTSPQEPVPDVQISFTAFAFDLKDGRAVLHTEPAVSLTICVARPGSRGRVSLRSSDPDAPPIIRHELLGDAKDLNRLVRGIEIGRAILRQSPIAPYVVEELRPGSAVSGTALVEYARMAAIPLYHPVGTCRMGVDEDAVVSPDLEVRGIDNLWVADASVMPALPIGNTNATAIMIGDKGADHILKSIRRKRSTATNALAGVEHSICD